MSTLKVNKLRDTAGAADAITLDPNGGAVLAGVTTVTSVKVGAAVTISESGIEATGVGITCANINGQQIGGRRNIIINGAMNVAERGTSFTSLGSEYTLDRFRYTENIDSGVVTVTQESVTDLAGFTKALKINCTTAEAGVPSKSGSKFAALNTKLEGQDLQQLAYGTSSAKQITLSFYVKSNITGTFCVSLYKGDQTARSVSLGYTINSANTWEKKELTFPADTGGGGIDNDNGSGLEIYWVVARQQGYQGTASTTWDDNADPRFANLCTATIFENTNDHILFTGIQLEVGSQATAFEHRSFGEELKLCQRYYYKHVDGNTKTVTENGTHYTGAYIFASFQAPTAMRTAPSIEVETGSAYYVTHSNGQQTQTFSGTGIISSYNGKNYLSIQTSEGGGTQGHATVWRTNNASARIAYGAEL